MTGPIKPSPIIVLPATVPETVVKHKRRPAELGGPKVIVRRGKGQATTVKIHRGDWT